MLKTIKIDSWFDIPNNFTGIVEWPNGDVEYRKNGLKHRENGPAIEDIDGTKYYHYEGKCHRIGGPAIEYPGGTKYYWIYGKLVSKEAHDLLVVMMKMKGMRQKEQNDKE